MKFKRISVIGAGGWGTALAVRLAESHASVRMWAHNPEVATEIMKKRTNSTYLPGLTLPSNVSATSRMADLADSDLVVMVTPSMATAQVAQDLAGAGLSGDAVIISCTKGIEHDTGRLMTQVISEFLPENRLAVLSGPNLAIEVARRIPAAVVIGCHNSSLHGPLQEAFAQSTLRVYTSDDVEGIQLGGALKNIFAIAAGVSDGFRMGDNAKAALVTRALAEMMRLGVALGGRRETFYGLSGVGDLMVTCFSSHSRNRGLGERLGSGEDLQTILGSMRMVAEGVPTALSAWQCAGRLGIEAPITTQVYRVLHEAKAPHEAMWELLGRKPKPECDLAR